MPNYDDGMYTKGGGVSITINWIPTKKIPFPCPCVPNNYSYPYSFGVGPPTTGPILSTCFYTNPTFFSACYNVRDFNVVFFCRSNWWNICFPRPGLLPYACRDLLALALFFKSMYAKFEFAIGIWLSERNVIVANQLSSLCPSKYALANIDPIVQLMHY